MRHLAALAMTFGATFDFFRLAEFHDGTRYTLHGLWPDRSDGSWPQFCSGPAFNATALQALQPRLEQDWPNAHGSSLALHRHEYARHGRCSGMSELAYFSSALAAYEQYSLNALVPPSVLPPPAGVLRALFRRRWGVDLDVTSGVSFCLSKRMSLIACPGHAPAALRRW